MSAFIKRAWLLPLLAFPIALACGGGDGGGFNPSTLVLDGDWVFREVLADATNAVQCQDNGILSISQGTAGFTGGYTQTGACVWPSGPVDNSGSYAVTGGAVTGTNVAFTQPGAVPCSYSGSLSGTPPDAMSGTLVCDGTFQATQFHFTGIWRADAIGGGPTPPGYIILAMTTTGTNLPATLEVQVSTTQGLIAIYTAAPNGNSTSPRLMTDDYEVALVVPGNCQVTSTNPLPVSLPNSSHGAFAVTCS